MISRIASSTSAEVPLGLLEPRAGRGADVQAELAGIDRREEVVADERQQRQPADDDQRRTTANTRPRCAQVPRQHARRTPSRSRSNARSNAGVDAGRRSQPRAGAWPWACDLGRQQVLHHRRHERPRQQVRGQHREHDGQGQRREQVLRRARRGTPPRRTRCRSSASRRTPAPAICWAPSRIACRSGLPSARLRWMFSISTVASSTRMPTASARPPSVITLSEWPSANSSDDRRQDRQRDRDGDDQRAAPATRGTAGSSPPSAAAAIDALDARTPSIGRRDEQRLVEQQLDLSAPGGAAARIVGQHAPSPG